LHPAAARALGEDDDMKITDPVCGRAIELDDSLPLAEHEGWVYFFCSQQCRSRFLDNPDRHAVAPPQPADS
jgi:Cu+-exporting ATPase